MAAVGDGITVGIHTLVKRLHESSQLKSIDEQRRKLKVRRILCGSRLEVLHLSADLLTPSIAQKTGPIGPSMAQAKARPVLTTRAGSVW